MKKIVERIALPAPAPGTSRELIVHRYGDKGARPKVYLHAALHADEHPGLLTLNHLIRLLDQSSDPLHGEIVLLPFANPVGMAQHLNGYLAGRYELSGGGNFNRNFPDLSEAVAEAIRGKLGADAAVNSALIRAAAEAAAAALPRDNELQALRAALLGLSIGADYVLDVHCDLEALVHIFVSHHHFDLGDELGSQLAADVVLLEQEPGGSPFDEANAGLWWKLRERLGGDARVPNGCFATTLELRGQADVSDDMAAADAMNIYRFLQRRGVIGGDPGKLPKARCRPTRLEGTDVLKAPVAGLVAYRKQLGDRVAKGEVVADIVDLTAADPTQARTPVVSRADGILFSRSIRKLLAAGETVAKVAGAEKLAHRKAGNLLEA